MDRVNGDGAARVTRRTMALLPLLLAGCSPVQVLNALAPSRLAASGIPYGPGPRHTLDIYAPPGPGPHRVVVFLYGGGWVDGTRAMYRFVGGALAERGFLTIIPDYRLYPEVRYPAFLEDCAAACAWTRAHAAAHGGLQGRFFLVGHSAGAYNAAMLALDPRFLGAHGLSPRDDLAGMVGLAGPYDFLPLHDQQLEAIFGHPAPRATQPIDHVDGRNPPLFLAAGRDDTTVMPDNTTHLAAAVRAAGGAVQSRLYPGIDHREIIGAFSPELRFLCPSFRDTVAFMGAHI